MCQGSVRVTTYARRTHLSCGSLSLSRRVPGLGSQLPLFPRQRFPRLGQLRSRRFVLGIEVSRGVLVPTVQSPFLRLQGFSTLIQLVLGQGGAGDRTGGLHNIAGRPGGLVGIHGKPSKLQVMGSSPGELSLFLTFVPEKNGREFFWFR